MVLFSTSQESRLSQQPTRSPKLNVRSALEIVPGATHLFEEPGIIDVVVSLSKRLVPAILGKDQKSCD